MDLREHTVGCRLSTYRDVLNDGAITELVASIEQLTGTPYAWSQDLGSGPRQRPGAPREGLVVLQENLGLGLQMTARVKLFAENPEPQAAGGQTLELTAGAHPYTGRFRTALELRVPSQLFEDAAFVERFVDWVAMAAERTEAFMAHAHDTDDLAIQNIGQANLLRSGFGLEVTDDVDVRENPGVEVSRGEFRYVASWVMVLGPEMVAQFGAGCVELLPGEVRPLGPAHWLVRLYRSPLEADSEAARAAQQGVREALGFRRVIEETAWAMGYWDKKSVART